MGQTAAQRRASLANLAKARAALRGRKSTTSTSTGKAGITRAHRTTGTTASAGDVTGRPSTARYRTTRLKKPRIRL